MQADILAHKPGSQHIGRDELTYRKNGGYDRASEDLRASRFRLSSDRNRNTWPGLNAASRSSGMRDAQQTLASNVSRGKSVFALKRRAEMCVALKACLVSDLSNARLRLGGKTISAKCKTAAENGLAD